VPAAAQADQRAAESETARLRSTGSGVSQIKNPWLRTVARIGDVAGTALFPGVAAAIPGTTLHHDILVGQQQNRIANDQRQEQQAANIGRTQADAAEAQRLANAPPPAPTPEQQFIEDYQQRNPTASLGDVLKAYTEATTKTTPRPAEHVALAGPDGKPMLANYDPTTGSYTDASGKAIPNPVPYEAPRADASKIMTGTLKGKPAFAAYEPGKGFVDPNTGLPMAGFAPAAANTNLSGMGAYALSRILQEETADNPAVAALVPALLDKLGIPLTTEQKAAIAGTPAGQPVNDAGQPIGTRMPEAPTGATRTRGQQAEALLQQLPSLEQQIKQLDAEGKLGPIAGRWNEFLVGRIGTNDPDVAGFRANLAAFVSGISKAHLNTEQGVRDFENAIGGPKATALNLLSAIEPLKDLLQKYRNIGAGKPHGDSSGGTAAPKIGDVEGGFKFKGGDPSNPNSWEKVH
jgi:hypothetical protein